MATMEKPKLKKKRKVKTNTSAAVDTVSLAGVDIDFPSTSLQDLIDDQTISQDCTISSQQYVEAAGSSASSVPTAPISQEAIECENEDLEIQIQEPDRESTSWEKIEVIGLDESRVEQINIPKLENIETTLPVAPSAPPQLLEDVVVHKQHIVSAFAQKEPEVVYPNLKDLAIDKKDIPKHAFQQQAATKEEKIQLKPFTKEQLRELYSNVEVTLAEQFEDEFINSELSATYKSHLLYDLLQKYSKSRYNLMINLVDYQKLKTNFQKDPEKVWKFEKATAKSTALCGDYNQITAYEQYEVAVIDEDSLGNVSASLTEILNLVCFNYTLNLYNSEVNKLEINQQISELLTSRGKLIDFTESNAHTELSLKRDISQSLLESMQEVRIAISILFHFLRRPMPDKVFTKDIKTWIRKLIAVQLYTATWQDHLFLIYHVLRCPAGVSTWATEFIQIPKPIPQPNKSPFLSDELNHCIAYLKTLLSPIKTRNEFLAQLKHDNSSGAQEITEDQWILVDSDGDEDHTPTGDCVGLKEQDLISLLNQIPMESLFCSLTFVHKFSPDNYVFHAEAITGHHLLKFISFSTDFVQLLGEGLKTYDTERYKQFAKMLSRLVRHMVLYVSDMHELFKQNSAKKDAHLCARIQIEYESFVLRASNDIYKSRSLGTWQYLAILPFAQLSIGTLWKLYYSLTVGFVDDVIENIESDFKQKLLQLDFFNAFNDTIVDVSPEDMYYLLQTVASMALSRETNDFDFIERITMDLFLIGYVNAATKENCYKISKDLLENITTKYPQLITQIVLLMKEHFQKAEIDGSYLFKSLPLNRWHPTLNDFEITASWLQNFGFESAESSMARTILSRLNWNFDENNKLFLPHEIHVRVACLIAEVSAKHVPEAVGKSGVSAGVRQVSNMVKGQTSNQQFTTWCWNMVTVLHLHCLDQHRDSVVQTLHNPTDSLRFVPELERLGAIHEGVSNSQPIALYLSILTSLWGHSVPQICHKGFIQMQMLLSDNRHATVIRCLHLIMPMFLECPESLSKCEKFQSILTQLLTSDRTYIKMAKDLITTDFPGPIMELLGNMMQAQIIDYFHYGLPTPTLLINLWLQCLTQNSNWTKDYNIIHLIDLILRIAYQFPDAWYSAKEYFRFLFMKADESKAVRTTSFLPFLGGSPSNEPLPMASPNALWLALMTLELEHEIVEFQTKLWPEILHQLYLQSGKFSLDTIIKKSSSIIGCASVSANALVLYKLANLIILSPKNHHVLPIICQKFFSLYLSRVPLSSDEARYTEVYAVADKFYETNISLMKKLKKYLAEVEKFYLNESLQSNDDEMLSQFNNSCSRLFCSFGLWLEETRLNKIISLHNIEFPPQYNLNKLSLIFNRKEDYWSEYINLPAVRKLQKDCASTWLSSCFRYDNVRIVRSTSTVSNVSGFGADSKQNIIRHLKSYDLPQPPPKICIDKPMIVNFSYEDVNRLVLKNLKSNFRLIIDNACQFRTNYQELNCLDLNYKEWIRLLYKNDQHTVTKNELCKALFNPNKHCSRPASIKIIITKPIINKKMKEKLEQNRLRHDTLIDRQISAPQLKSVECIVTMQHYIRRLIELYRASKYTGQIEQINRISSVGIQYFYEIINGINEDINFFPPSNELCVQIMSSLGIFILDNQATEGIRLLETALKRPNLVKFISELFVPSITAPKYFLEMYKFVVDSYLKKCDVKVLFVLLSKFDINKWLLDFKPKLYDITQLIQFIIQGLESWNQNDATLIQGVLRRHLIHIFEYEFPEHYGEVLQIVISGCSDQKLMPSLLLDLLNSIYKLAGCSEFDSSMHLSRKNEEIQNFATTQKLFSYKDLQDTILLLARHFQNDRLQHGLHGLYPKHKDYCDTIVLLFKSLGFAVTVQAVHAFPGTLADRLVDWLWPCICDLYSPWIIPYFAENMLNSPANWMKQIMANNQVLLPWSELHLTAAHKLLHSYVECVQFILDTLPSSDLILGHIFYWYDVNFSHASVPKHVLSPVNSTLVLLPWNRFKPTPVHINCFYRVLKQYLPDCHSYAGYVFLRVAWTPWLQNNINLWDYSTRQTILSSLLMMFVKLAYEPNVRENMLFLTILQEATAYPWHLLDYRGIEEVFEWFVTSTDTSVILKLSSEYAAVDNSVINLLQVTAGMLPTAGEPNQPQSQLQSKRMLYVKSVVRMLRICGSKYQQLLSTKEGLSTFHCAVTDLVAMIDAITGVKANQNDIETISLMIEIIGPLQTHGEFTSRKFVEAMLIWQSKSQVGNSVLSSTINAIGTCKILNNNLFMLLEATVYNYFRSLDSTNEFHKPSWSNVIARLGGHLPPIEGKELIQKDYLLCLHIYAIYKLKTLKNVNEKITFLEIMLKYLENYKTNIKTESKIAILWGLIVGSGYEFLQSYPGNYASTRNQLFSLGRYLQSISAQNDGWGEGLLGAIGLKKDDISKKRRILTRCLSCVIFSLFPDSSDDKIPCLEYRTAIEELIATVNSKKFTDIREDGLNAVEMIVNHQTDLSQTKEHICSLIRLFYKEQYLHTLEDVWKF